MFTFETDVESKTFHLIKTLLEKDLGDDHYRIMSVAKGLERIVKAKDDQLAHGIWEHHTRYHEAINIVSTTFSDIQAVPIVDEVFRIFSLTE